MFHKITCYFHSYQNWKLPLSSILETALKSCHSKLFSFSEPFLSSSLTSFTVSSSSLSLSPCTFVFLSPMPVPTEWLADSGSLWFLYRFFSIGFGSLIARNGYYTCVNQLDIRSSFISCLSYIFNVQRIRSEFGFERVGFRLGEFGSVFVHGFAFLIVAIVCSYQKNSWIYLPAEHEDDIYDYLHSDRVADLLLELSIPSV